MARKPKIPPAPPSVPEPSWKTPGIESAVVYEDELPWNKEKGICFEITESRGMDFDRMEMEWSVRFAEGRRIAYTRRVSMDSSEWYVDQLRKDARLDILYRAHKEGVI